MNDRNLYIFFDVVSLDMQYIYALSAICGHRNAELICSY